MEFLPFFLFKPNWDGFFAFFPTRQQDPSKHNADPKLYPRQLTQSHFQRHRLNFRTANQGSWCSGYPGITRIKRLFLGVWVPKTNLNMFNGSYKRQTQRARAGSPNNISYVKGSVMSFILQANVWYSFLHLTVGTLKLLNLKSLAEDQNNSHKKSQDLLIPKHFYSLTQGCSPQGHGLVILDQRARVWACVCVCTHTHAETHSQPIVAIVYKAL